MANSSEVTSILLSAYYGMEEMKPMYFCIFLFLYIIIIAENAVLIRVICIEKSLHEPMYFLMCNLAANGLYGGTALFPALLSNTLSHSYEISLPYCQTQIYAIHTYAIIESTILAAMSYDRYVAICHPLQYHVIMTMTKVFKVIAFTWFYPLVAFFLLFSMTLQLRFCEKTIPNLYCVNYALVKLSCRDTYVFNIVGVLSLCLYTVPQLAMILYSYVHIFIICALSSKESKLKALRTCSPHLVVVINYYIGGYFEVLRSRFDMSHVPYSTRLFLSLYYLIFPLILNPAIYGVCFEAIRRPLFKIFQDKKRWLTGI